MDVRSRGSTPARQQRTERQFASVPRHRQDKQRTDESPLSPCERRWLPKAAGRGIDRRAPPARSSADVLRCVLPQGQKQKRASTDGAVGERRKHGFSPMSRQVSNVRQAIRSARLSSALAALLDGSLAVGGIGDDETGDEASGGESGACRLADKSGRHFRMRAASADLAVARTVSSPPCAPLNRIGQRPRRRGLGRKCRSRRRPVMRRLALRPLRGETSKRASADGAFDRMAGNLPQPRGGQGAEPAHARRPRAGGTKSAPRQFVRAWRRKFRSNGP